MIIRKSRRELERMAAAGSIVARTLDMLRREARAGVTTGDLDRLAEEFIRAEGGIPTFKGYHGFTGSICSSPNDMIVHGIPGPYELRDGDVISLDVGVTFRGWVADSAITVAVGEVARRCPPSARDLSPVPVRRDRDVPPRCAPVGHRPRGADPRRGRGLRRRPGARGPRRRPADARGPAGAELRASRPRAGARRRHGAGDRADDHGRRPCDPARRRRRLVDLHRRRLAVGALRAHGRRHASPGRWC